MRIKITFSVFQDDTYRKDVEGIYMFEDPAHAVVAMAHFANCESAAAYKSTTCQAADRMMFEPAAECVIYPPAMRSRLGVNTHLVIKSIEFL